jgi:hypothetical protein
MLFGTGVRNGVEELHSEGAFDDVQAPQLNGLVRAHIYEALVALDLAGTDGISGNAAQDWLYENGDLSLEDPLEGVLPQAVVRAIDFFCDSCDASSKVSAELIAAGTAGLRETLELLRRAQSEDTKAETELGFLMMMIPSYWEEPELSPGFRERLRFER